MRQKRLRGCASSWRSRRETATSRPRCGNLTECGSGLIWPWPMMWRFRWMLRRAGTNWWLREFFCRGVGCRDAGGASEMDFECEQHIGAERMECDGGGSEGRERRGEV